MLCHRHGEHLENWPARPKTAATRSSAAVSGPTPYRASRPGARAATSERVDELVEAHGLVTEELGAPSKLPQRDAGGVADDIAGAGPQRRQAADQADTRVLGESDPQVVGAGQAQGPRLVIVWVRSARALRSATISTRIASTAPSRPFGAPRGRPD